MTVTVEPARRLRGSGRVPGDKSISHRAFLIGAIAEGTTTVEGAGLGADVLSTVDCLQALGVPIRHTGADGDHRIEGRGLRGLTAPSAPLHCGNSGTTLRLLCGILAGQRFSATLIGDPSLSRRPMERIAEPLRQMQARVELSPQGTAPITVAGGSLRGIEYRLPVASAQVKSCILLAALYAAGKTSVLEPLPTRDHTERLLSAAGAALERTQDSLVLQGGSRLVLDRIQIPGDFSSAAFLLAAGALLPGSEVEITQVGLNPTRTAFLELLAQMGAEVESQVESESAGEPVGSVRLRGRDLQGVRIGPERAAALIDELPLVAALAARAQGSSEIRGAAELRKKESDRIATVAAGLRALGARVEELQDGWVIAGPADLRGAAIDSCGDHRVAMALAVLALTARGSSKIRGAECVAISFPGFFETLEALAQR